MHLKKIVVCFSVFFFFVDPVLSSSPSLLGVSPFDVDRRLSSFVPVISGFSNVQSMRERHIGLVTFCTCPAGGGRDHGALIFEYVADDGRVIEYDARHLVMPQYQPVDYVTGRREGVQRYSRDIILQRFLREQVCTRAEDGTTIIEERPASFTKRITFVIPRADIVRVLNNFDQERREMDYGRVHALNVFPFNKSKALHCITYVNKLLLDMHIDIGFGDSWLLTDKSFMEKIDLYSRAQQEKAAATRNSYMPRNPVDIITTLVLIDTSSRDVARSLFHRRTFELHNPVTSASGVRVEETEMRREQLRKEHEDVLGTFRRSMQTLVQNEIMAEVLVNETLDVVAPELTAEVVVSGPGGLARRRHSSVTLVVAIPREVAPQRKKNWWECVIQ